MLQGQEAHKERDGFISIEKYMLLEEENNELSEKISTITTELLSCKQELAQLKKMILAIRVRCLSEAILHNQALELMLKQWSSQLKKQNR